MATKKALKMCADRLAVLLAGAEELRFTRKKLADRLATVDAAINLLETNSRQ